MITEAFAPVVTELLASGPLFRILKDLLGCVRIQGTHAVFYMSESCVLHSSPPQRIVGTSSEYIVSRLQAQYWVIIV